MVKFLSNLFSGKKPKINIYNSGFDDTYLVSSRGYAFAPSSIEFSNAFAPSSIEFSNGDDEGSNEKDKRISVTPKSVLNELEKIPNLISLVGLDDKIHILKEKSALISSGHAKREIETLLICLQNRKKYNSPDKSRVPFRDFFSRFDATTDEKIDILLKKYALVMKSADIFIPEFPVEAIETMKAYSEKIDELCGKKVVFMVIAEAEKFRDLSKKRDPILLAQSPFGFYYYILGAWDKEMILLSEL